MARSGGDHSVRHQGIITMLAATLLGTFKGDDETTQITFKGDGPIGQIIAISDNTGMVKGLVGNPAADPPLRPDGKLNVGGAVGRGLLTVSRAHPEAMQLDTRDDAMEVPPVLLSLKKTIGRRQCAVELRLAAADRPRLARSVQRMKARSIRSVAKECRTRNGLLVLVLFLFVTTAH